MKSTFRRLCVTLLLLGTILPVSAQQIPRHEFTVSLSVSANIYLTGQKTSSGESISYTTLFKALGFGPECIILHLLPLELGYTYHFDGPWGISTGVGITGFTRYIEHAGYFNAFNEGTYPLPVSNAHPLDDPTGASRYNYSVAYSEGQNHDISQMFITVPVLAQYRLPIGKKGLHFYAQGGVKLGFLLSGIVESDLNRTPDCTAQYIYSHKGDWYTADGPVEKLDLPDDHPIFHAGEAGDEQNHFNLFASLESGIRIPFKGICGMYIGAFTDLGLIRAAQISNSRMLDGDKKINACIFTALDDTPYITTSENTYTLSGGTKPLLKSVLPFSAGVKIKFAF